MEDQAPTQHQRRGSIRADGHRDKVRVADVQGRFTTWRRRAFFLLILVYAAAPLVKVGGKPLIFLDIADRRFFLFGQTFNAQDAYLLFFLLAGGILGIFLVTALLGRLWCGWACPQTVFLEGIFRPIERLLEGSSHEQLRLARLPLRGRKLFILTVKHGLYLLAALLVSHIFISYFVSLEQLRHWVLEAPGEHWTAFLWMGSITGVLYFNFAWFREQTCVILCPYGRLQSALTDDDTVVIGYDALRGEPRGKAGTTGAGDCVDCLRCVEVCPTAIDIREGLQLECIGCANCIDACDDIMTRLERPIGLIRYDSFNGLAGRPKRWARPRVYLYVAILGLLAATGTAFALGRRPFEAMLIRQTGAPYVREDVAGTKVLRNQYFLHVINKTPQRSTFSIQVTVPEGATAILPLPTIELDSLTDQKLPLVVSMPQERYEALGSFDIVVTTRDEASGSTVTSQLRFLGP